MNNILWVASPALSFKKLIIGKEEEKTRIFESTLVDKNFQIHSTAYSHYRISKALL
jgi:hypothetical protein